MDCVMVRRPITGGQWCKVTKQFYLRRQPEQYYVVTTAIDLNFDYFYLLSFIIK